MSLLDLLTDLKEEASSLSHEDIRIALETYISTLKISNPPPIEKKLIDDFKSLNVSQFYRKYFAYQESPSRSQSTSNIRLQNVNNNIPIITAKIPQIKGFEFISEDVMQTVLKAAISFATNNKDLEKWYRIDEEEGVVYFFESIKGVSELVTSSKGDNKRMLLPKEFEEIIIAQPAVIYANLDYLDSILQSNFIVKLNWTEKIDPRKLSRTDNNLLERFRHFICYFYGKAYAYITTEQLSEAIQETKKHFYGADDFIDKLQKEFEVYTREEGFSQPKGFLIYGPPGTGKTSILCRLFKILFIIQTTSPMAAGDIRQGIQGDSERVLNAMAARAKLVPWEMTITIIDEIDSLAANRKAEGSSTSDHNLMGVLLSLMDGAKIVMNFKIAGTTNLLSNIDEAASRRFDVKLFLGNPNSKSREAWITGVATDLKIVGHKGIQAFISNKDMRENFIKSTMNFSADGMKRLLNLLYQEFLYNTPSNQQGYYKTMNNLIQYVSEKSNIKLGTKTVIEHLKAFQEVRTTKDFEKYVNRLADPIENSIKINNLPTLRPEKICLVNLASKSMNNVFQFKCSNREIISDYQLTMMTLFKSRIESKSRTTDKNVQLLELLCLTMIFPDFHPTKPLELKQSMEIISQVNFLEFLASEGIIENYHKVLDCYENNKFENKNMKFAIQMKLQQILSTKFNPSMATKCTIHYLIEEFLKGLQKYYCRSKHFIPNLTLVEEEHSIRSDENHKKFCLPLILGFAQAHNANNVKYIDSYTLVKNSCFDDNRCISYIKDQVEEAMEYDRTVLAFHLDSISQTTKHFHSFEEDLKYSSSKALEMSGKTFSYEYGRKGTIDYIMDLLQSADPDGKIWYFAISGHNKVLMHFKEKLNWPASEEDREAEKKEKERNQDYRCQRCNEVFKPKENMTKFECGYHKQNILILKWQGHPRENKEFDKETVQKDWISKEGCLPSYFQYKCCGGDWNSKGCMPDRHIKGEIYKNIESA